MPRLSAGAFALIVALFDASGMKLVDDGMESQPDRTTRTAATHPNAVWAADFKGWFRTRDGQRCDPLTISDLASRYVLACRLVAGQRRDRVRPVFRQVFRRFGLPEVLRVDNGPPFGSRAVCGLSQLSAW